MFHEKFRIDYPFEKRWNECNKILERYPDRIPILVSTSENLNIDRHKYLVPNDITFQQFSYIVKKRINCKSDEALFYYMGENNIMPRFTDTMKELYYKYKSTDGYLILIICKESTFG
jgi:GABA(A) receptor-associated protein